MLLENFYRWQIARGVTTAPSRFVKPLDWDQSSTIYVQPQQEKNLSMFRQDAKIRLGAGTVEPNYSDYTLTDDITSSFIISTPSYSAFYSDVAPHTRFQAVCTVTNNTASPLTITEYGLSQNLFTATSLSSSASTAKDVLFFKELLNSPITILPGEQKTVTFEFTM